MSSEIRHDKKVTIVLDRPYQTNGKWLQGEVTVSQEDAEDLERRQRVWRDYDQSRHRDNGKSIDTGAISGGN